MKIFTAIKKPIEIEAIIFDGYNSDEVKKFTKDVGFLNPSISFLCSTPTVESESEEASRLINSFLTQMWGWRKWKNVKHVIKK